MYQELLRVFASRKGHLRLESGHHGDLRLDQELLCLRPAQVCYLQADKGLPQPDRFLRKHRLEWTMPEELTMWLAVFYA